MYCSNNLLFVVEAFLGKILESLIYDYTNTRMIARLCWTTDMLWL